MTGLFLPFLKYIVPTFSFRVLFRHIYYSDRHKAPDDKPLILAGNHPASFLDGVIVSSYFGRPVHYLVRGDMFGNKFKVWLLRQLNISPIYRLEEGYENVHRNEATFKTVHGILRKNENMIIFGEGTSRPEKRLRPLRKGIARMAFGAEALYDLDIHVVPVGINYTYPTRFRKQVMIRFHDPIPIRDLMALYRENKAKAYRTFNQLLETALQDEVIIVEDEADDQLAEHLFVLSRNDHPAPFFHWKSVSDEPLRREKAIADKINIMADSSEGDLERLSEKVGAYFRMLNEKSLNDKHLATTPDFGWLRTLVLWTGWPVFLAGYLGNIFSFLIPKYICDTKIRQMQFYLAVYMGIGTVLYILWFPLIMVLLGIFMGWWGLLIGLAVPVSGYLALFYTEMWRERMGYFRFKRVKRRDQDLIKGLLEQREEIQSSVLSV